MMRGGDWDWSRSLSREHCRPRVGTEFPDGGQSGLVGHAPIPAGLARFRRTNRTSTGGILAPEQRRHAALPARILTTDSVESEATVHCVEPISSMWFFLSFVP